MHIAESSVNDASKTPAMADAVSVLVVDDETMFARAVSKHLQRAGMHCDVAGTLAEARTLLESSPPDLILLDMRLPDGSGLDFLASLGKTQENTLVNPTREADSEAGAPAIPVVVLTAFGDLDDAVAAMKQHAVDYLTKPIDLDELLLKLQRALQQSNLEHRLQHSQKRESHGREQRPVVGNSDAIHSLLSQIERVQTLARSDDSAPPTVLLLGETGTGKDLCAQTLHAGSARSERPFVHLDCAALPRELIESELFGHQKGAFTGAHSARTGLLEAAENGTLFLDEIGELPLEMQTRLLAVLERRSVRRVGESRERVVPAWFIAATNRDLEAMVRDGSFRSDLYYRLNVLSIHIPALRERSDDIPELVQHYAERTARRYGLPMPTFTDDALRRLRSYHWPGNVRELINIVERSILLSDAGSINVASLGLNGDSDDTRDIVPGLSPGHSHIDSDAQSDVAGGPVATSDVSLEGMTLEQAERQIISEALQRCAGNVSQAARQLGITRMALRYRLEKHGITAKHPE